MFVCVGRVIGTPARGDADSGLRVSARGDIGVDVGVSAEGCVGVCGGGNWSVGSLLRLCLHPPNNLVATSIRPCAGLLTSKVFQLRPRIQGRVPSGFSDGGRIGRCKISSPRNTLLRGRFRTLRVRPVRGRLLSVVDSAIDTLCGPSMLMGRKEAGGPPGGDGGRCEATELIDTNPAEATRTSDWSSVQCLTKSTQERYLFLS